MEKITLTLPFPPSVNGMYQGGSKQKRFPSKQYKEWTKLCEGCNLPQLHLTGVFLTYYYWFPDKRERDTENYVKAVSDRLVNKGVLLNDSWQDIKGMRLIPMGIDRTTPRVQIDIEIPNNSDIHNPEK